MGRTDKSEKIEELRAVIRDESVEASKRITKMNELWKKFPSDSAFKTISKYVRLMLADETISEFHESAQRLIEKIKARRKEAAEEKAESAEFNFLPADSNPSSDGCADDRWWEIQKINNRSRHLSRREIVALALKDKPPTIENLLAFYKLLVRKDDLGFRYFDSGAVFDAVVAALQDAGVTLPEEPSNQFLLSSLQEKS